MIYQSCVPHGLRLLPILLVLAAASASATYKCNDRGNVTYTDVACANGHQLPSTDLRDVKALQVDRLAASERAEADKSDLKRLVDERQRNERTEALQRQRSAAAVNKRLHICAKLGLRKKWLEEDVGTASKRSARKVRTKLHRIGEQYALECAPI